MTTTGISIHDRCTLRGWQHDVAAEQSAQRTYAQELSPERVIEVARGAWCPSQEDTAAMGLRAIQAGQRRRRATPAEIITVAVLFAAALLALTARWWMPAGWELALRAADWVARI